MTPRSDRSARTPHRLRRAEARRLLARYHLRPTDVAGVFDRHGAVQLDPLDPMATSHDLMLHARVDGYRRGAWRRHAYEERRAVDAWDRQASLVALEGWHWRRAYQRWNGDRWRERVLDVYPEAVRAVLAEVEARGPSAATDLAVDARVEAWRGSWYGPRLAKNVLRALWHTGRLAIHHRRGFHHVYDLVERVVPAHVLERPPPGDDEACDALMIARVQAAGLHRCDAPAASWGVPLAAAARRARLADLVDRGELVPVEVDGRAWVAHPEAWHAFAGAPGPARSAPLRFLAPLDPLVWDREALLRLFDFDYVWEVYKPVAARRWGYYVLPVIDGERLVARLDGRVSGGTWQLSAWWWEPGIRPSRRRWGRLERAFARTAAFLGVEALEVAEAVPREVAAIAEAGIRTAEAAPPDRARPPAATGERA